LSYCLSTDGFRDRISSTLVEVLCFVWSEVTRVFTTPEIVAAGIIGPRLTNALSTEPRQVLSAGFEPATFGSRSNSRLHHAANFTNLHTRPESSPQTLVSRRSATNVRRKFREESALTEPGFEPAPCDLYHEVAVNYTIPGNTSPRQIALDRNDLSRDSIKSREPADFETGSPRHRSIVTWVILSHSSALHAQ
jgi:hypothetical protein